MIRSPSDPLAYPCPTCGMGVNWRCMTTNGTQRFTAPHAARWERTELWVDRQRRAGEETQR